MGIFLPKKQAKRSGKRKLAIMHATGAKRLTQAPRPHIMPSMETKEKNLGGLIGNIFRIFRPGEEIGVTPSEDRIRERAYALWEEAGRPDGDGVEFWVRAETEVRGKQN